MSNITVLQGDCLDILPTLESNSVDSVVTDPPYELGFMGKKWDASGIAYNVDLWREVLRVLKPGGHLLAFGGTRTYHRMTCAIEDAGFEIRDCLQWLYGSGFPKSLDVSKAIDRARDDKEDVRVVCRFLRRAIESSPYKIRDISERFGFHPRMVEHWAARDTDSQPSLPRWEQWVQLKALLNLSDEMDAEVWRLDGRKGTPGESWYDREVIGRNTNGAGNGSVIGLGSPAVMAKEFDVTKAATPEAEQWDGWGTALKPANEPIVLARKPLEAKTVAANVLAHGTGALNIDGCRIPAPDGLTSGGSPTGGNNPLFMSKDSDPRTVRAEPHNGGRWPANVLLDEESAQALDEQTSSETSRFFYVAKASKRERGAGNTHPTVKPIALMQYLIRLITPPGGTVLDMFAGSGTTGLAAQAEGVNCILVEREPEYVEIITGRLSQSSE